MKFTSPDPSLTKTAWHTLFTDEILENLAVTIDQGLGEAEVTDRRRLFGPNEFSKRRTKNPLQTSLYLLSSPFVLLIILAGIITAVLGDLLVSGILFTIVLVGTVSGVFLENRAGNPLIALQRIVPARVRVRRAGLVQDSPGRDLVPGDIILLQNGDTVPADARLLETANLRVQEAILSGDPRTLDKTPQPILKDNIPLADRHNMVFMGTSVTYGRGLAVVVATGMQTELGRIAASVQGTKNNLGITRRYIHRLGGGWMWLFFLSAVASGGLGLFRNLTPAVLLENAAALAVAAAPIGLPFAIFILFAFGTQRMLKRQALVRHLQAVETLGAVNVVCTEKSETLLENWLNITLSDAAGLSVDLIEILENGKPVLKDVTEPVEWQSIAHLMTLAGGALCSNALLERQSEEMDSFKAWGDPTEGALLVAAARFGLWKSRLDRLFPRMLEVPYSTKHRSMSTIHHARPTPHLSRAEKYFSVLFNPTHPYVTFVKGDAEHLLSASTRVWSNGRTQLLTEEQRSQIHTDFQRLTQEGKQVVAVAFRPLKSLGPFEAAAWSPFSELPPELHDVPRSSKDVPKDEEIRDELEKDLILLGYLTLETPTRAEVLPAIQACRAAGIRPILITSDHPNTALMAAKQLQFTNGSEPLSLTGRDIDQMSPGQLEAVVDEVTVFAQILPEHKIDIVNALQKRGNVVAMTGNNVNDAPALWRSDIGVTIGNLGTDVSREAAQLRILDDHFSTFVHAVVESRRVLKGLEQFTWFTLSGSLAMLLVSVLAPILGMPLPLTIPQILWIATLTGGLPGLALALTQDGKDAVPAPPVHGQGNSLSERLPGTVWQLGTLVALITLVIGYWVWLRGSPAWTTIVFSLLVFLQSGNALAYRLKSRPQNKICLNRDWVLFGAVTGAFLLQIGVVILPGFQQIFNTIPPNLGDLLLALAAGSIPLIWIFAENGWNRQGV